MCSTPKLMAGEIDSVIYAPMIPVSFSRRYESRSCPRLFNPEGGS